VLELLQDVHFPLNRISFYAASTGPTLALLDELGCIFDACTSFYTTFDNCKLPTADTKEEKKTQILLINSYVVSLTNNILKN